MMPSPKNEDEFANRYWDSGLKFYKLRDMMKFCEEHSTSPASDSAWSESAWSSLIPSYLYYNCESADLRNDIRAAHAAHPDWYVTSEVEPGDINWELYQFLDVWFERLIENW
jgi:hypothetical protein